MRLRAGASILRLCQTQATRASRRRPMRLMGLIELAGAVLFEWKLICIGHNSAGSSLSRPPSNPGSTRRITETAASCASSLTNPVVPEGSRITPGDGVVGRSRQDGSLRSARAHITGWNQPMTTSGSALQPSLPGGRTTAMPRHLRTVPLGFVIGVGSEVRVSLKCAACVQAVRADRRQARSACASHTPGSRPQGPITLTNFAVLRPRLGVTVR